MLLQGPGVVPRRRRSPRGVSTRLSSSRVRPSLPQRRLSGRGLMVSSRAWPGNPRRNPPPALVQPARLELALLDPQAAREVGIL
jgi:hypothetical protein